MTCGDGKRGGPRGGDLVGIDVRILWGRVLTWHDDHAGLWFAGCVPGELGKCSVVRAYE
jgi:hypothetical protein